MKNGMGSRAQCAVNIHQSKPNLVGGFALRTLGFLKRVFMQDLTPSFSSFTTEQRNCNQMRKWQ